MINFMLFHYNKGMSIIWLKIGKFAVNRTNYHIAIANEIVEEENNKDLLDEKE